MSVSNQIISLPPLGKPNPEEKYERGSLDSRSRVVQSGSKKGDNCVYYVFNYLRERIGKHKNCQDLPERQFEKLCSKLRKEITESSLAILQDLETPQIKEVFLKIGQKNLKKDVLRFILEQLDPKLPKLFESFEKQAQFPTFYDYLYNFKNEKKCEILEIFLKSLSIDPKKKFEMQHQRYYPGRAWENFKSNYKQTFLEIYTQQALAEGCKLPISSWNPTQSIESLSEELKESPLFVGGHFGVEAYACPPTKHKEHKLKERDVYYWNKTDPKKSSPNGHAILLVGADIKTKIVYYIDPIDESDPAHPERQRIFMMSYERLKENVVPLNGIRYDLQMKFFSENLNAGFAYKKVQYHPQN